MSIRMHRSGLMLAASALALMVGPSLADTGVGVGDALEASGNGVHADIGTDVVTDAGAILLRPNQRRGGAVLPAADVEPGVTLVVPPASGAAETVIAPTPQRPASLSEWTPDDLVGTSVVNETGMRIATVDSVAVDASGETVLVLAIDAQPGARRAVPFDRFALGTSGGALMLAGASDAELVAMADYDAAAAAYTPITVDTLLGALPSTAASPVADSEADATLVVPPAPSIAQTVEPLTGPVANRPATLAAWTPEDLTGASVVNETGMRIATVDSVAADASGAVNLILAIDARPGALRAVPYDRFGLGTSGGALLLVGATDAELVAMADAAAGLYTPITTDAELQAHLQTAAGN